MATNLQIDDRLIERAVKLGRHATKKAAVTEALETYVRHMEQEKILKLFATVDYGLHDYKKQRAKA